MQAGEELKRYFLLMNVISIFRKSTESIKYEIRTKFMGLIETARDEIVRFVFDEERRNRQKELL